ncbi:calpain-9-like isoform X1 [Lampetra fluviatilis]
MAFFSTDNLGAGGRGGNASALQNPAAVFGPQEPGAFSNSAIRNRGAFVCQTKHKAFAELKRECLAKGALFEDAEFPATDSSLGPSFSGQRHQWKRPQEIVQNPEFIVDGATRTDIKQGALGDCWLLAAIASLTLNDQLLAKVVPPGQNFRDGYAGIFHFQFWHFGEWMDVFIDDRLPTKNGQLVFVHSADKREFWSALLEKAYSKLNGSYEALKGGSIAEAMEDFTGGVYELLELKTAPPDLFRIMCKARQKGSMMGCSIDVTNASESEARTSNGLVKGHAYSITGVDEVNYRGQKVKLLRIRNPWGEVEWNGAWSDHAPEWKALDQGERNRLQQVMAEDGEFWMSFDDFMRYFTKMEICNLTPDRVEREGDPRYWTVTVHDGRWLKGCTAGGCRNFPETFWTNPQFRLKLHNEDDEADETGSKACSFIVALMQKNMRKQQRNMLTMGYAIYKIPDQTGPMPKEFFLYNASKARSPSFINLREVSQRFRLPAGEYVIVPSTFEPHQEADFLVRVFAEKPNRSKESDDKIGADIDLNDVAKPGTETEDDRKFKTLFGRLAGEDMEISPKELQDMLNKITAKHGELESTGFSMHACRSIVALTDVDGSGKLGLQEFRILWNKIKKWQAIFRKHDEDLSGTMSSYEMKNALNAAGFQLNSQMYQLIIMRYTDESMLINFNDYITCLVRLDAMFRAFYTVDKEKKGFVKMPFDQWMTVAMYA